MRPARPKLFFQRLAERIRFVDSLVCIGLDPQLDDAGGAGAVGARDFCLRLIDATASQAAAFKPNAAFFEAYGAAGWEALAEVIRAVPDDIPVILDAKRGDIANTAEAYARSVFEELEADAVTLSPYLGRDSIDPFLVYQDDGVFLLCKTSNPGSADLQDLLLADGNRVYEQVARMARQINKPDQIGLVAGATYPEAIRAIRSVAPEQWILAPGVGAQGGDLRAALQAGIRSDGLGMLLPVSRLVAHSHDPRKELERLNDLIREIQAGINLVPQAAYSTISEKAALARDLLESGCVQFGAFTLKSGLVSPIYIDLRRLASYPAILAKAAGAYKELIHGLPADCLAGLPYGALPIATALSLQTGLPLVYPRKEAKEYGTKVQVEGVWLPGQRALVIDDLATTGCSKFEAIDKLTAAGLQVKDVVVLIDRQSGAREALQQAGYRMHSVFTLTELLDLWQTDGRVTPEQAGLVRTFLEAECITA